MAAPTPAQIQFAELVERLVSHGKQIHGKDDDRGARRMFASTSIKTGTRMFAFLERKERLVVKLPEARVTQLIATGQGAPYNPGVGRIQREWVVVVSAQLDDWFELASEAQAYVATLK